MKMWMARMNLEYMKPATAHICSKHFAPTDVRLLPDGRRTLSEHAQPHPYVYRKRFTTSDDTEPSMQLRLIRLPDRQPDANKTLTCVFCNVEVTSNFMDLWKQDSTTHQARLIIAEHYGIDVIDAQVNVRCICQVCWTITQNFRILHQTAQSNTRRPKTDHDALATSEEQRNTAHSVAPPSAQPAAASASASAIQSPARCDSLDNDGEMLVEYLDDDTDRMHSHDETNVAVVKVETSVAADSADTNPVASTAESVKVEEEIGASRPTDRKPIGRVRLGPRKFRHRFDEYTCDICQEM